MIATVEATLRELRAGDPELPPALLSSVLDRDLGFDSLARMELLMRTERTFGLDLPQLVRSRGCRCRAGQRLAPGASAAQRPCVRVSNHASDVDGVILVAALPRPCACVAKRELQQPFVARHSLRRRGAEFVERHDVQRSVAAACAGMPMVPVVPVAIGGWRQTSSPPPSSCARRRVGPSPGTSMAREPLPWPRRPPATRVRRLVRLVFVVLVCGLPAWPSAGGAVPVAPAVAMSAASVVRTVQQPTPYSVHVVNRGWHAGLVLRARDVPAGAWAARADFPDADYLEVGWGDRAYYMAADPGPWLGLKAVAWPTPGVLHVVGMHAAPERFFPDVEILEIGVAPAGMQRLLAHLRQSHELDGAGHPITLGPGLYGDSRFYASREQFHLFKTCNVWVATALEAAGVQVTPAMTLTTERLMAQLRPLVKVKP